MLENSTVLHNRPLLSIAIPTKSRYEYLNNCLETLFVLKTKYPEVEIVVQDNTTDNSPIIPLINKHKDEFKYYHIPENISVVENCDNAIAHCSGEFICLLGDDDSVADSIIDVVKWMKDKDIESCVGRIVRFNWPDMVFTARTMANLIIPSPIKNRSINAYQQLLKVIKIGGSAMLDLPKVYHALISKKALERVKDVCGTYFPGPSPDMANGVALALSIKNHMIIDTPFVISGFSYKSTGGAGTRRKHVNRIEDVPHLPKDTAKYWDKRIPEIWTGQTIYADSVIQALKMCKRTDLISRFNFNSLYGTFLLYHWNIKYELKGMVTYLSFCSIIFYYLKAFQKRCAFYTRNVIFAKLNISKTLRYYGINDLKDAVQIVNEYNEKNLSLL